MARPARYDLNYADQCEIAFSLRERKQANDSRSRRRPSEESWQVSARNPKEPFVVTRSGNPVAVLIPPDNDTLYELSLVNSPRFPASQAEGQRQIEAGECSTHEAFWKKRKAKRV
jgi:PHD/YefM family antitoxin component YafN of YafNO toxin-antitoxin module